MGPSLKTCRTCAAFRLDCNVLIVEGVEVLNGQSFWHTQLRPDMIFGKDFLRTTVFSRSQDPKRSFRPVFPDRPDRSGGAPGTETMRQEPAQVTRAERFCVGIGSRPVPPL